MEVKNVPIGFIIAGIVFIILGVQIYLAEKDIGLLSVFIGISLFLMFIGAILWYWDRHQIHEHNRGVGPAITY